MSDDSDGSDRDIDEHAEHSNDRVLGGDWLGSIRARRSKDAVSCGHHADSMTIDPLGRPLNETELDGLADRFRRMTAVPAGEVDFGAIADHLDAISRLLRAPLPPPPPPAPVDRYINATGLALVKRWEGLVLTATPDITGLLTIGWGHTGSDVKAGQTITETEAEQLLSDDLTVHADFVDMHAGAATDNQFAAMVSLAFNIGNGDANSGFLSSTVLRQHKAANFAAAADAFLLWDKAHVNGQLVVVKGLLNRRVDERALYLTV